MWLPRVAPTNTTALCSSSFATRKWTPRIYSSSPDTTIQATDNFSWTVGKHSIKFGADLERVRFDITGNDFARGGFSFTGTYTDVAGGSPAPLNAVADFLLGDIASQQGQPGIVADQLRDWALVS
jgi:hypothetical protein